MSGEMKLKLSDEAREQFRRAGSLGGRKGSREDKVRAGKLGHARMVEVLSARRQQEREHPAQPPTTDQPGASV